MKPRIRKVEGFWHCVAPDAQGIGITPELAHREYWDLRFDLIQARIEESRQESERKEIEYQTEMAKLNMRCLMAAYGYEMNEDGKVIRDHWMEGRLSAVVAPPVAYTTQPPDKSPLSPKPMARWWEFWK